LHVGREAADGVFHGISFPAATLGALGSASGPHRVLDESGELLAVYEVEGRVARPEVVVA
jgi:hypothetical protein